MIGGGGLMAVSGTGAFSNVDTERGFTTNTVSDENALLGIRTFNPSYNQKNNSKKILELSNQTESDLDIDITIPNHSFLTITKEPGDNLGASDGWVKVMVAVSGERRNTNPVDLTITAASENTTITATRTIDIQTAFYQPNACPVSLNVTVDIDDVGDDARDGSKVRRNLKDEEISGDINAKGKLEIENSIVDGNVNANNIEIKGSQISGDVTADNNIKKIKDSDISGDVTAGNSITEKIKGSQIGGSVTANKNNIKKIKDSEIGGNVTAGNSITEKIKGSQIGGSVTANKNNIKKIKGSTVCGGVDAGNKIKKIKDSEIGGTIMADGDVTLNSGSTVSGINAGGDVTVNGTVKGDVYADGDVDGSGTINGNDPRTESGGDDDDDDD